MLKFIIIITLLLSLWLGSYYFNTTEIEIIYLGKTTTFNSADGQTTYIQSNLEMDILDNPDVLCGKFESFSDTMVVGETYKVKLVGFDNYIFGPKNIISIK